MKRTLASQATEKQKQNITFPAPPKE